MSEKKTPKTTQTFETLELQQLEAVSGGGSRRRRAGRHSN